MVGTRGSETRPRVEGKWHRCLLEQREFREQARREVREGVAACRRHPAVLLYCVGKEIPPAIVRWHGARKVGAFLRDLYDVAKDEDPDSLVTYTNFPTTEYLELPFVDVYTFNVSLRQRPDFCAYLSRLQHIAGELPLGPCHDFARRARRHQCGVPEAPLSVYVRTHGTDKARRRGSRALPAVRVADFHRPGWAESPCRSMLRSLG